MPADAVRLCDFGEVPDQLIRLLGDIVPELVARLDYVAVLDAGVFGDSIEVRHPVAPLRASPQGSIGSQILLDPVPCSVTALTITAAEGAKSAKLASGRSATLARQDASQVSALP
jgi:hypothetical protein